MLSNRAVAICFLLVLLLIVPPPAVAQVPPDFKRVEEFLQTAVDEGTVAGGALLVWHRGDVVLRTGFGFADLKSKTAFRIDTPVIVASISKPILGTALYRLSDAGKLDVGVPVDRYLPEFAERELESGEPLLRAPTITELLTHTGGLRFDKAKGGRVWFQSWTRDQTLDVVVNRIARDFPFKAQPGTKWAYSGIGTEVAARVGEVASGLPRNEFLVEWLAKPLGMNHTRYQDVASVKLQDHAMPTRYYRHKESGQLRPSTHRPAPAVNHYGSSGGTIISTAPDLLNWLLMMRNEGRHAGQTFLEPQTLKRCLTAHTHGKNACGGLFVRAADEDGKPTRFGHAGSSGTNVWLDVKTDTIGIMLTQTRASDIKSFRLRLEQLVTAAVASATAVPGVD